jgi:hypothetical protein
MQDFLNFLDRSTVHISGKNHYALLAFLKKHGGSAEDVDRFVEEAGAWRMLDREMAFRRAAEGEEIQLFTQPHGQEETDEARSA